MNPFKATLRVFFPWGMALAFCFPPPVFSQPPFQRLPPTGDSAIAPLEVPASQEPHLSQQEIIALLRKKVRYVFILYQENRSFDSYFGTFPGVDGLYSQPKNQTPGFKQLIVYTKGKIGWIEPFLIGPRQYAADLGDPNHSHIILVQKMDVVDGKPLMDRFALTEEKLHLMARYLNSGQFFVKRQAMQYAELAMSHVDGDTIPFLWRYANRFVIFDHIFQLMTADSTPGNLSVIAAQTGQTQAALHPWERERYFGQQGPGEPVLNDSDPFWGSPYDTQSDPKMPVNPTDWEFYKERGKIPAYNQTYATLPLSLAGSQAQSQTTADPFKKIDLADVTEDVAYLTRHGQKSISWGWFQEGYGEPIPAGEDPIINGNEHASYVTHHNGPQYFGYIVHNPEMRKSLHDLKDFFTDVKEGKLSNEGGVYYVKGGYRNIFGMRPADPDLLVQFNFLGDDDHPADSDSQISEALLAHAINAIAQSQYWSQCAIIITWDDCGGFYDHVPPPIRNYGANHDVLSDAPRLPFLLISPYARVHTVVHKTGDTGSIVKFVDTVFDLTPLAQLPDELKGRQLGKKMWKQPNWGPDDALTPDVTDLADAFDPARLMGSAPILPPDYAEIPPSIVDKNPQVIGYGLKDIGIVPTNQTLGIKNHIPPHFNPRPEY